MNERRARWNRAVKEQDAIENDSLSTERLIQACIRPAEDTFPWLSTLMSIRCLETFDGYA